MCITLSKSTSRFDIPNIPATYFTSCLFASPSVGGAAILTPTPSEVIPKNNYVGVKKTEYLCFNVNFV